MTTATLLAPKTVLRPVIALARILDVVARVAPTACPVLLVGKRGTGAPMIAEAIHQCSPRKLAPLVSVKCGLYPREILTAQLFGHEPIRWPSRQPDIARIAAAEGGTLFIEQIQLTDLAAQVEFTRLLKDREYMNLHTNALHPANVRLIASARSDLAVRAEAGLFREDLFSRLSIAPIEIPKELITSEGIKQAIRVAQDLLIDEQDGAFGVENAHELHQLREMLRVAPISSFALLLQASVAALAV